MKGYAMLKIGESGWIEKERPACGPMDAIVRPLAVAICTSDVHTLWEGAIGERHNMILGHEACGVVDEVGELVRDFKPGDKVLIPAITPDWNSLEAQAGYSMHSGGMLAGWKFSNFKDGVFGEFFHVNDADGNLAHLPENINPVDACMLSDMVPTGFHGVELADVQFGDEVLVIGIGPVGLMSVAGANLRGASRIIAVGTTSVRTLETIYGKYGTFKATRENTSIFISPGYEYKAVDCLITNFHLPKSTLVMLVSAFMGRKFTLECYAEAVKQRYRFFSFGDSMFIYGNYDYQKEKGE